MWRCSKCGEESDEAFDACWNCGADRDATVPADAETLDATAGEQSSEECGDGLNEKVVELCSASDIVEAYSFCNLLEQEGIPARIVGDVLGNVAGGVPLGEPVTPRIWVRERDRRRALELLDQTPETELGVDEDQEDAEAETVDELDDLETPSSRRFDFLSQGFYIVALVCVIAGASWAWRNQTMLSMYSATTEGQYAGYRRSGEEVVYIPNALDSSSNRVSFRAVVDVLYEYVVDGKIYNATVRDVSTHSPSVVIHYDPNRPGDHVVGPLTPPWLILVVSLGSAAIFAFVGYQFG